MLKDHIPKKSKEPPVGLSQKIVEDINRMLESDMRRAVTAALNRRAHSPLPSASAIDFPYTIRRNLRHYHPQLKTIVPERVYFFDRFQPYKPLERHPGHRPERLDGRIHFLLFHHGLYPRFDVGRKNAGGRF